MKTILRLTLVTCLALASLGGCSKNDTSPQSAEPGKVISTPAYEKYFGTEPTVDKGTAYAFVIFFPSAKTPGKVVPFPFFTFDEASIMKVAMERLLVGMTIGSYQGEFAALPSGSRLLAIKNEQGTVTVNVSKELFAVTDKSINGATATAIGLTVRQFKGVENVRVLVEDTDSSLSNAAQAADDSTVQEPSPPRLLSVTAMRDKGAKVVEDVNAFFDRPVEVRELKLLFENGQRAPGDLYHSVFDMAAVLKPKDPTQFREKMPIRVLWKVTDKRGRQAEGDSVWPLAVQEH
ncbi:MAG TPA: GerMN domain-containing protein [Geobacteraceae bacterium]